MNSLTKSKKLLPNPLRLCMATLIAVMALSGCASTTEVRRVDVTPAKQSPKPIAEAHLLDVGILHFQPNIPEDFDEQVEENILPDIRRAEAYFLAYQQKLVLKGSGNWGAVRVLPAHSNAVDVLIEGSIDTSNGERIAVHATVTDATGRTWLEKRYEALTSRYSYGTTQGNQVDPYHGVFRQIADDMLAAMLALRDDQLARIKIAGELRFARDFSSEGFGDNIEYRRDGQVTIKRLPAEDDPMLARVRAIREKEYLFIDTLDEYYAEFNQQMSQPYHDWRRESFEEVFQQRELERQALTELIVGAAMVAGGIAAQASDSRTTRVAGTVGGIGGGATLIKSAFDKRAAAKIHSEILAELGQSAGESIAPHTIDLENRTIALSGNVEAQYEVFRAALRRLYFEEMGLGLPEAEDDAEVSSAPGDEPLAG